MIRAAVVIALLLAGAAAASAQVALPDGYRMDGYRAPVPDTLPGATAVTPPEAHALRQDGAVFIDVLPRPPKPDNLPEGTIWHEAPRLSVPGAIWLPNVGYGALADPTDRYFREGLAQASGGDTGARLVFFCLADCWMSWNAAKRAQSYGYSRIYWLREGTDGWAGEDYPLQPATPWKAAPG